MLSFELLPTEDAKKKPNGNGRDQPNNFPALPEPMGRFTFVKIHFFCGINYLGYFEPFKDLERNFGSSSL